MIKAPQVFTVFGYKYGYARTSSYEYVMENYGVKSESEGNLDMEKEGDDDVKEGETQEEVQIKEPV